MTEPRPRRRAGIALAVPVLMVTLYMVSLMTLNFYHGAGWIAYSQAGRAYCTPYLWYTENGMSGHQFLRKNMSKAAT
jgi:hypothetical protein